MQMIDKFNEKLKQIVDEEQVTWYQLSCAPPDSHENIIALQAKINLPNELADFLSQSGALKSYAFADTWQTVQLFSANQLLEMQTGLVEFIDDYWGGRPEFAAFFSTEQIKQLNEKYHVFGLTYIDDNGHNYFFFDQQGKFGHLPFDQDDCEPTMTTLNRLLISSNLELSLEELLQTQLDAMLNAIQAEQSE